MVVLCTVHRAAHDTHSSHVMLWNILFAMRWFGWYSSGTTECKTHITIRADGWASRTKQVSQHLMRVAFACRWLWHFDWLVANVKRNVRRINQQNYWVASHMCEPSVNWFPCRSLLTANSVELYSVLIVRTHMFLSIYCTRIDPFCFFVCFGQTHIRTWLHVEWIKIDNGNIR